MRYVTETRLRPGQVMALARDYFGPTGRCGLQITERGLTRIVFAGGGGYVIVTPYRVAGHTRVEFEVWEFDTEVRGFMSRLPGPEGWFRRQVGRWVTRRAGKAT